MYGIVLSSNVPDLQTSDKNTSINKPKSVHNKSFNENLSKPIPNMPTESCD